MKMDAGMDTGPMLEKEAVVIDLQDNAWTLAETLASLSADLLVSTLLKLNEQMIRPVPQDDDRATYAPLIQKADYQLDWHRSALALHNQIRGFYPNCVTAFRQQPLKALATVPLGGIQPVPLPDNCAALAAVGLPEAAAPGTVAAIVKNYGAVIATGDGYLLLREVKPAGKQAQSGWDFANGARLAIGESLISAGTDS